MLRKFFNVALIATFCFTMACAGNNSSNNPSENASATESEQKTEQPADAQTEQQNAEDKNATEQQTVQPAEQSVDLSKKYICPSRCESSDNEGVCSQCGMDYIENLNN